MLTDPFLLNAEKVNTMNLLSLEPLRFLAHFYTTAGLTRPPGAEPYDELNNEPTWERSKDYNFRGHMFGHYLSAMSMIYVKQGAEAPRVLQNIRTAVQGLKECQDAFALVHPDRAGYIAPFGDGRLDEFDGLAGGTGLPTEGTVWVPWYNLHKVLAGLLDIYKHVTDDPVSEMALDIAKNFGTYFYNARATRYTDENRKKLLHIEYGGMNDAFYELFRLTGDARFKTCAECFDEVSLFDALAARQDVLPGRHANTQIPKFIGALKRYTTLTSNPNFYNALTDDEKASLDKYLQAAKNFFDIVLANHSYITGGNSVGEHFRTPQIMAESINREDTHETCNGHNMLKLARALFIATQDKKYADYYENAFINVILSSQNPETGQVMYFQPMGTGYNKHFGFSRFWCCVGTGVESFAKLGDSIYFAFGTRVYVNMYFNSVFTHVAGNLKLTQAANLPDNPTITFTFDALDDGEISPAAEVYLRIPDWCAGVPTVVKNAVAMGTPVIKNGYIVLTNCAKGDTIKLTLPMTVACHSLAGNTDITAFRYGSVVLSAAMGYANMDAHAPNGILVQVAVRDAAAPSMLIIQNGQTVSQWKENLANNLVRTEGTTDAPLQFKLNGTDQDDMLFFTPHYRQYKNRYGLYFMVTEPNSPAVQAMIAADEAEKRERAASSAYLTNFDNHAYEGEYRMQSHKSSAGSWNGRSYRHASGKDCWFGYTMPIFANQANMLSLVLSKADKGRVWAIYINDEFFAEETIVSDGDEPPFYTVTHRITDKYTTGDAQEINLKFRHADDNADGYVGGIFGMQIKADC
ncbi:MAG: glycoside hydrolase family 127 protein [Defluviitaleaceae bacterium]|nr:glycoside hydrolase family 127 protein [Defluviitaleaceae bacterium]